MFNDPDVIHVDGRIDPADDIDTINTELILADLQTVDSRLAKLAKEARKQPDLVPALTRPPSGPGDPRRRPTIASAVAAGEVDPSCSPTSTCSAPSRSSTCSTSTRARSATKALRAEAGRPGGSGRVGDRSAPRSRPRWPPSTPTDAAELLAGYGQDESGLVQLVHVGFRDPRPADVPDRRAQGVPGLDHPIGATAPQAAGTIHTDFERGFIKAEIVSYDDLVEAGSLAAVRAAGKARVEGKDYVMRDGDVVEFRFNV